VWSVAVLGECVADGCVDWLVGFGCCEFVLGENDRWCALLLCGVCVRACNGGRALYLDPNMFCLR
jgi:hypothetical protein